MNRDRFHFLLLNLGHFLDHLFMLVFATVAALALHREWNVGYSELLAYATPGFFAFGIFALPAGWLADRWSRDGMMCVFFIGIGVASVATGLAQSPLQIGIGLFAIGIFGAIYHPVGLAIVTITWRNTGMRIAANGVWGNLGVASAAIITGYLIDHGGWRMAFIVPGVFSCVVGLAYAAVQRDAVRQQSSAPRPPPSAATEGAPLTTHRGIWLRVSSIVFFTTAVSSIIFQSTTFALPKVFDERMRGLAADLSAWATGLAGDQGDLATAVGSLVFVVFAVASIAQLLVGSLLDRFGSRSVYMMVAGMQVTFFALMPGLDNGLAFAVAIGFMFGAFGQIPINDFMIGKMASGAFRARIYAVRFLVGFTVLALTLPLVAIVYDNWGFDTLFHILAASAFVILCSVALLPRQLPEPEARLVAAE
jgi:MFS family permease